MCKFVKGSHVAPGWGCCHCRVYNGLQRMACKSCGIAACEPLVIAGDCAVGEYYEDGATKVDILAVDRDVKGYGIRFRSKGGDIPEGHEWRSWTAHDYRGLWRVT